jgi:hypothetical protein
MEVSSRNGIIERVRSGVKDYSDLGTTVEEEVPWELQRSHIEGGRRMNNTADRI